MTEAVPVRASTWDASWRSFTAVQGGVIVGNAMGAALDVIAAAGTRPPLVRASTTHFLAAVVPTVEMTVVVRPDRLGSTSSVRADTEQAGPVKAVTQVLTVAAAGGPRAAQEADLPPGFTGPDDGEPLVQPAEFVPFTSHLDFRAVGTARPLGGGPEPRLTSWVRLRIPDDLPDDITQLGVLVDCLPPSLYAVLTAPVIVPTVELTVHVVAAPPARGAWVRVDQWVAWQDGGVCVDDAVLHDEQGRLVARVRQTRGLPR